MAIKAHADSKDYIYCDITRSHLVERANTGDKDIIQ